MFRPPHLSLHQSDPVPASPPTGFDQLLDLTPLNGPHSGACEPLQHWRWQTSHTNKDTLNHLCILRTHLTRLLLKKTLTCSDFPALRLQFLLLPRRRTTQPEENKNTECVDVGPGAVFRTKGACLSAASSHLLPFPFFLVESGDDSVATWEAQQQRTRDLSGQFVWNVLDDRLTVAVHGYDLSEDVETWG